jgi:hypothetical protein
MEPYLKNKLKAKGLGDGAPAQQAQDIEFSSQRHKIKTHKK